MGQPGLPDPGRVLAAEICLLVAALAFLLIPDWPVGFVEVHAVPSGSTISPDGAPELDAPAWVPVPPQGVRVTISHPGYASLDTLLAPGSEPILVYLEYMFRVTVTSDPSDAGVFLDGVEVGRTPVSIDIGEAGTHLIELVSVDSLVMRDTVILASNRPESLHFSFPTPSSGGMVFIPGGEFEFQGGPGGSLSARRVVVESFYLGATEVTNAQFCSFLNGIDPCPEPDSLLGPGKTPLMVELFRCDYPLDIAASDSGGYRPQAGMEIHPVRGVTFAACTLYCEWLTLNEDLRHVYRLPSEIEWEYAATAGDGRTWPWGGSSADGSLLNCSDASEGIAFRAPDILDGFPETSPVGFFPPNPWGLRDMAGNVWEWCSDWQGGDGLAGFDGIDTIRCLRGGSWLSDPGDCRSAVRLGLDAGLGYPFAGFRVAAEIRRR